MAPKRFTLENHATNVQWREFPGETLRWRQSMGAGPAPPYGRAGCISCRGGRAFDTSPGAWAPSALPGALGRPANNLGRRSALGVLRDPRTRLMNYIDRTPRDARGLSGVVANSRPPLEIVPQPASVTRGERLVNFWTNHHPSRAWLSRWAFCRHAAVQNFASIRAASNRRRHCAQRIFRAASRRAFRRSMCSSFRQR